MPDSANIRSGLRALMQDHLSDRLVNTLVEIMPLVSLMLAKDGNKKSVFGKGRFSSGTILRGLPLSKPQREKLFNTGQYMPVVQTVLPLAADGKVMTMHDTVPLRNNWTTTSPASYVKRPFFRFVERADPIMVPKKEIRRTKRASQGQNASAAVGDLFRFEADAVHSTHITWWNDQLWTPASAPTNVDAEVWDNVYSIAAALKADNVYGGVDRSLAGNAWWRGNYVTAKRAPVLEDLVNEANYTFKCAAKGLGINLILVGLDLFPVFKAEAKAKGGQIMHDGLPELHEFGCKREVVRHNNTYVIMDPRCPSKARGDAKNVAVGLNLDTWTLAVTPEANFTVDEPFDLSKTEGGKDAIKSQERTELMLCCEAPNVNAYWEDVG